MRGSSLKIVTTTSQPQPAETQSLEFEFLAKFRAFSDATFELAVFLFRVLVTMLASIQRSHSQQQTANRSEARLTVKDCAQFYQFNERTLREWAAQGKIPHYKLNDEIRFDRAEIDAWAKRGITK